MTQLPLPYINDVNDRVLSTFENGAAEYSGLLLRYALGVAK
jgi:hypothetical protein